MIVAEVTTPVPMLTATGRKSPSRFTLTIEVRCIAPNEQRKALKTPARKRPVFRILGLHPGYGTRFLATVCMMLAFILATSSAGHATWSHDSSGSGRSHRDGSSGSSSSDGTKRSHHRKSY
jgi:hypothetical protein